MRYFVQLAYNGTRLSGWQRQQHSPSVQARIEEAFFLLLRRPVEVTGCGRTDAGVHARLYYAHFDFEGTIADDFLHRANRLVGNDIFLERIFAVAEDAHARFDATRRAYEYHLSFERTVFEQETVWQYPYNFELLDHGLMQQAADLLLTYESFFPFCKSGNDAKTMRCTLSRAEWIWANDGKRAVFHIASNRFLRGQVRLVVGMCINVGVGQLTLEQVRHALNTQTLLPKSLSVPPTGLFLTEIDYPFL